LIFHSRVGRDHRRALRLPVAIAEPAVILPAGVDDMGHGLVGDGADDIVQRFRPPPRAARVDLILPRIGGHP